MSRFRPVSNAFVQIGITTVVVVCILVAAWAVEYTFGLNEPSSIHCEKIDGSAVATATKIRGNQFSWKHENSHGTVSGIASYYGPFTCVTIFGGDWMDAKVDYD